MSNKQFYKVIILGVGPAGISCALFLKKYGISDILIIDKNNSNIHKACSGILTDRSIKLLTEIGVKVDNYQKWSSVSAYYNNSFITTYNSGDVYAYQNVGLNRIGLDEQLFNKIADEKIEYCNNISEIKIDEKNHTVNGIKYTYLIDARGYSVIASKKKRKMIGIEAKISSKNFYANSIAPSIYLSNDTKGYKWFVNYEANVTIGFTDFYQNNTDLMGKLNDFAKNYNIFVDSKSCDIRAAFLPIKPEKKVAKNDVVLIGDRAGLVDPLTQEGICYALLSAKFAAISISNNDIDQYKKMISPIVKSLNRASLYRSVFFNRAFQDKLWNISQKHKFTNYIFAKYSSLDFFDYTKLFDYHGEYKK